MSSYTFFCYNPEETWVRNCVLDCNPIFFFFWKKKIHGQPARKIELRPHICSVGLSRCRWNRLTSGSPIMLFVQVLPLWDTWGGKQNLVALVSFFSLAFFSDVYPGRSAVFTKTRQPSICRLPQLQNFNGFNEAKTRFPVERASWWWIFWIIVTDGLRQLKPPSQASRSEADYRGNAPASRLNGHSLNSSTH